MKVFNTYNDFFEDYNESIEDHEAKSAYIMDYTTVNELTYKYKKQGVILKNSLYTIPLGVALEKNHFFYDLTNAVMSRLVAAGIPQHLLEYHSWVFYKTYIEPKKEPFVLKLSHLEHGFVLWMIACGISILAYICEVIRFKMRRPVRKIIGNWLFWKLLKQRLPFYRV